MILLICLSELRLVTKLNQKMVTKKPRKTRFKEYIFSKIRRKERSSGALRPYEKSRDKLLEKKHATMNSRSSALPTRTDILLSCGFTFLEFLDLWTLNSLYELGLKTRAFDPIRSGSLVYWKKRVRKYIEKTKQEVKFAYANIDFFKQENIPYSCRTFEKCASYGIRPPARAKGPFLNCLNSRDEKAVRGLNGHLCMLLDMVPSKISNG